MTITFIRARSGSRSRRSADSNPIGIRYEKTVQAEPPIPLPPRNTSRNTIRTLSIRSTASSPSPSVYALSLYSPSLVVVAPPPLSLPSIPPPTEQHPALRTPVRQAKLNHDTWKRDSGHAPTPTSAATIYEEDCEEDEDEDADDDSTGDKRPAPWPTNADAPADADAVRPQSVSQSQHGTAVGLAPAGWQTAKSETLFGLPAASASFPALPKLNTAVAANRSQPRSQPLSPNHPSPSPASSKRHSILKRLSGYSSASAKGKLALAVDEGSAAANAPMQPLMRGEQPPPASTHKQPQRSSPGTAQTSALQASPASPPADDDDDDNNNNDARFAPLGLVAIPTDSLLEDDFMATLSFSNRGSIMLGGRRAAALGLDGTNEPGDVDVPSTPTHARSSSTSVDRLDSYNATASNPRPAPAPSPLPAPDIRILTSDIEKESQKVRSLYGVGDAINWEDGARRSYCEPLEPTPELPAEEDGIDSYGFP